MGKRIMILDGAMGTEIQTYGLQANDFIGYLSSSFFSYPPPPPPPPSPFILS